MVRKTFRKIITTKETKEQINPKNKKLIEGFLKEKDRKCSDATIKNYRSDLNIFFCWNALENDNKFYPEIKKMELSDFFNYTISEMQWKGSRFSRMRSCLSSLSDYVIKYYDEDYPLFKNFVNAVIETVPKDTVRKKTILSEEQVNNLLRHLDESNKIQEALLLATAISSGARVSELTQLKTTLIDENYTAFDDVFLETTDEIRTKGFGKNGHQMTKFIIKDIFLPYYKKWLPIREKILKEKGKEHDSIFITRTGDPANAQNLTGWIRRWEDFLDADVYMHCFRHYFVTQLTRIELTSDFITEIVGWKSGEMYKIYNDLSAKDRKWKDTGKLQEYLNKE